MSESKFTILFRHWLRANPLDSSAAFELKVTDTNRLSFAAVQEHQLDSLVAVKHRSVLYKAPDDSRQTKPFDLFYLNCEQAYVVIKYPNSFHIIDVEDFIYEKANSEERSLTSERAREIATYNIDL